MNESYHCNPCNQDFPDKETATEHRDATGHELNIVKLENEIKIIKKNRNVFYQHMIFVEFEIDMYNLRFPALVG